MNDIGAALAKTVEVENDGGNQLNMSDIGDDLGDEPIDMGDEPTHIGDDPSDEPTNMGDYEDQTVDTTEKVNEDLTGPFPGGPYDPSILKSFHCHVAAKIWHNDECGILKCLNHGFKVGEWSFNLEDNEQSKFHVSCKKLSNVDVANLLVEALGVTIDEANVALKVARGQSIKVEWLRQRFGSATDVDNDNTIECAARAYLLGCTLFADKTAIRVPVVYLPFLMDLRSVASYAWSAAALAFLYRQLGTATRYAVKQMAGYMTLLEGWIYEHLVGARPHPNLDYKEDQPRVFRWISRTQSSSSTSILQRLREDLDRLEAHDVIWDPYHDKRIEHPFSDVAYYSGCLKCMHIVEPYHPDRRIDSVLSISRSMLEIGYNETAPT
ncbi:protein MAIN-LIKE 2-like [Camellia sinensis]|uniref:protein MAIN-LIKE 2-like n=1 Tax=Camellia sinensis TaxID=4442 RepID=UPI00103556DE|nr:protein MAIN-LIKE 2-like [Camellia sinensis]